MRRRAGRWTRAATVRGDPPELPVSFYLHIIGHTAIASVERSVCVRPQDSQLACWPGSAHRQNNGLFQMPTDHMRQCGRVGEPQ